MPEEIINPNLKENASDRVLGLRCFHNFEIIKTIQKQNWYGANITVYHLQCKKCGIISQRKTDGW